MIAMRSTELLGLFHIVGGQHHGTPFGVDRAHQFPEIAPGLGVQAGSWFVQKYNLPAC